MQTFMNPQENFEFRHSLKSKPETLNNHRRLSVRPCVCVLSYLSVMRKLQRTYRMEPAGSQGVWGLDDFQFLPFIWGSSQFIGKNGTCVITLLHVSV